MTKLAGSAKARREEAGVMRESVSPRPFSFDSNPVEAGELFILRNAGSMIPSHSALSGGEGATIEFAVAGLG